MNSIRVLASLEILISLGAGYFFAAESRNSGAFLLFMSLLLSMRADKRAKKETDKSFVRIGGRISDAFVFSGIAIGLEGMFAIGLSVLFLVIFVPNITSRLREFRGQENRDIYRKYRIIVLLFALVAETAYSGAIYAGLGAIIGLILVDFVSVLRKNK